MKTIHMIFNAHIDPIWLWPWQEGLDVVLATCRSACDILDRHPDMAFSQGEAWVYREIEKTDPALLDRIRAHVRSGRWELVGGWWLQPDCNFPSGPGFEHQISLGKAYFRKTFGFFPKVAYNIDSFGHAATLPRFMRAAGQRYYVMMRPQSHEKHLPARLFRWRGFEGDAPIVTFRIAGSYNNGGEIDDGHVRASVSDLPPGVEHTMCFVGLGDHGGGPTEKQIAWVRKNAEAFDGCRLVFSTPSRFFAAVAGQARSLPLVTGELQMHAVGCYSVYRPVKTAVVAAEHALCQAEIVAAKDPSFGREAARAIEEGWRKVCTHHFHDTLGGTCIPSAYPAVEADLGAARSAADDAIQHGIRRMMNALPDDTAQRIVLFNASDAPFDGYTEFEPWFDWRSRLPGDKWRLADEEGRGVAMQFVDIEAMVPEDWRSRALVRVAVPPASMRILRIVAPDGRIPQPQGRVRSDGSRIENDRGAWADAAGRVGFAAATLAPRIDLIDDPSDTWSHDCDRYGEAASAIVGWDPPLVALMDDGPLMESLVRKGHVGDSKLLLETRIYAGMAMVDLRLCVNWMETNKILKLVLPLAAPAAPVTDRIDGIPGGALKRELNGRETPTRDWTLLTLSGGVRLGVVSPDTYAIDATPDRARLTLLRSPFMAHHYPRKSVSPRARVADQGYHEFRVRIFCDAALTSADMDREAFMLHRPLIRADLTRGMKPQK